MASRLSELIETAPGFRAAVNIVQEQNDTEKSAAFLPTEKAAEVLFDIGRQLEPRAKERARLITGTYGTGKSHLALVATMLYRGRFDDVGPVIGRLEQKFPGQAQQLEPQLKGIQPDAPYLVVLVEGDQDSFDAALVRGLRNALDAAGMADYMPSTYFSAAAERLLELMEDAEAAPRLEGAARDEGLGAAAALVERLNGASAELEDLDRFRRLHERVCFGAPFLADTRLQATETYQDAVQELIASGRFSGIVVIWDEFGTFMDQVVREPGTGEGLAVQRFAEACQDSGAAPLHVYLIAHRSLSSYIRRAKDTMHLTPSQAAEWEQDFKKVSGRFREFMMESEPEELYTLVDDVLIQKATNGWTHFRSDRDSDFQILTETAYAAELFPDLTYAKLRDIVIEGCYPLAAATAAFLPRVAELVAQNQRTLFTFLCGDHPGTAADFLRKTPVPGPDERLPLLACDKLWDYFEQSIQGDHGHVGQAIYRRYRTAVANSSIGADDGLGRRVLKVLALFDLIREGDPERAAELPAREEQIALALDLRTDAEREELRQCLDEFSRIGSSRVAVCGRDGAYRLISGTGTELHEALEQLLEQRRPTLNVAQFLRKRWGKGGRSQDEFRLGLEEEVDSLTDRPDMSSRTLATVVILAEEMENLRPWVKDLGDGDFVDGLFLLVLPTEDPQMGTIGKGALGLSDNPQVVVARPQHALRALREVVARVDALEEVARQESGLWGSQGERRDEWDAEYQDAVARLTEMLQPVALRQNTRDLQLECFWQGSPRACKTWSDVRALADEAMEGAFRLSPHTNDDIMRPAKRDGLAAARRAVVDKLLDARGPELLLQETDQAQARLVRLLEGFDVLKAKPRPHVGRPEEENDPGASAIWSYLEEFERELGDDPQEADRLVRDLRSAPYGVGERMLPLLLAAAWREPLRSGNILVERRGRSGDWQARPLDGGALDDVLITKPSDHRFRYISVSDWQVSAIQGLITALAGDGAVPQERQKLIEEARSQVTQWWGRLPHHSQQTRAISANAARLRDQILRPLVHPNANAHDLLVEQLRQLLGNVQEFTPEQFAEAFRGLVAEIEGANAGLPNRIAHALQEGLRLDCHPEPEAVVEALNSRYNASSATAREFCHPHDAGKLQGWVRNGRRDLTSLCESIMGHPLEDWSDADVGYLVGRAQAAVQAIEEWTSPVSGPGGHGGEGDVEAHPGQARLTVDADLAMGRLNMTRQFAIVEPDQFSEMAKVILRLLTTNLAEDQSLLDGERENVLLQLIRRVFGDE